MFILKIISVIFLYLYWKYKILFNVSCYLKVTVLESIIAFTYMSYSEDTFSRQLYVFSLVLDTLLT